MVAIQGILLSQKKVMRFLGFQFSNPEPFKWQVYMWINWILLFLVASAEVAYAVAFRGNLAAATSALCPVLYCMNSLPKMFSILLRRNRVYRFLARLDDLTAKGMTNKKSYFSYHLLTAPGHLSSATTSGRTILDKSMRTDSRMFVIYAIPSVGVLYLYLIAPLIVDNYNTWKYGNSTWDMPMKSLYIYSCLIQMRCFSNFDSKFRFPYDVHYSPAYQLTTLSFWISASSGVYYCVALDSLCYGSAINLRGHFQVVQSQIATIQHENRSTNMISKELCQLVRYHMEIVDLCEELNRIASPIMFAQFVTASLQICVVGFQFTIVSVNHRLFK